MSAPSESATSPSQCACTNISLMQLFHELKQKFPGVPDHVVSNTIELYCHDKQACEKHLHSEVKASLTHAYHASSSAAARQLNELKVNPPGRCRNQPIIKHEAVKATIVTPVGCEEPQTAIISLSTDSKENRDPEVDTDANQNVVNPKFEDKEAVKAPSPITVINIDKCFAKYNADSPSDLELTNENSNEEKVTTPPQEQEQLENTNYRILKSNKIKSNLNEKLEKNKEKKTIKKEEPKSPKDIPQEKPKRPDTLDFVKPNPDFAFKPTLRESDVQTNRSVSPLPASHKHENLSEDKPASHKQERGYPLNLSVNVNCHMDYAYGDPWMVGFDSPRAITSVNLTVCTPTSNMASPVRDYREDDGGFEGHVTVTVSPSTARPPRRRAPPPPTRPNRLESPRPTRVAPEPPGSISDRSLIERQKERLSRLAMALAQEKARLAQLNRENQILEAPPPTPTVAQRLREDVERLRDQCDTLSKRLEMGVSVTAPEDSGSFYSNIYTGQRPPSSWQCHMCTFRNHPLLDKCEECDMPRIFVGTSRSLSRDSGFFSMRDRDRIFPRVDDQKLTSSTYVPNIIEDQTTIGKLNC